MTEEDAPERRDEPSVETRLERSRRYGHLGSLYFSLAVFIAAAVFLILLIAKNTRQVRLDYVFGDTHSALIWLIIVSAIMGWILGIATAYLVRRRTRRRV